MGKEVPFKEDKVCDSCGAEGAYDFYGDYFCPDCCFEEEGEYDEG